MAKLKLLDFGAPHFCGTCGGSGESYSIDHSLVGSYVWKARRAVGMKQGELANALAISQTYMCDLEKGNRNWSDDLFTKTMNILEPTK